MTIKSIVTNRAVRPPGPHRRSLICSAVAVATVGSAAVATPAFAARIHGVGGFLSVPNASYCARRWAYYDPSSWKYMDDDGQWRPCR